MLSLWIVHKDLLLLMRNKKALLTLLLMPLILIAILGSAFSDMFSSNEAEGVTVFHVGVVDEDHSEHSKRIIEDVLRGYLSRYLTVEELSLAEVKGALDAEEISVAMIIPQNFGENLIGNKAPQVEVVTMGDSSIHVTILKSALVQYQQINLGMTASATVLTSYYTKLADSGKLAAVATSNSSDETAGLAEPLHEVTVSGTNKTVESFQYYAVAMGVMFLTMTVVTLVGTMIEEKNDPVFPRQLTTTLVTWQYTMGKFIGLLLVSMLQLSIIIGGTSLLFGVDWGESFSAILLTMLSYTLSTAGLGVLVGSFMKSEASFSSMGMIGTQIFSALGGSFVPFFLFPDWLVMISKIIPNALALQMFIKIMTGGTVVDIIHEVWIASGVGLLLLAIAWLRLSRKGGAL